MKKRTHATEIAAIRKLIGRLNGYAYVLHQGAGGGKAYKGLCGTPGIPDMFVMQGGHSFFVEVKVGKDRLRVSQQEFIERGKRHGVDVVVGDLDAVIEFLGLK